MLFKKKHVDFIIGGAQKAGTSALDYYLRNHPQIGMAHKKELHFFDDDVVFNSKPNYKNYFKQFQFKKDALVYGEATPIYLYWKPSCKRIFDFNPNIKLIFILRNPIERAYSHWNMEFERGAETHSFSNCIRHEQERLNKIKPAQHRVFSYLDRGKYAEQIKRFQNAFPAQQLLFIKYEDFEKQQEKTLRNIFSFLGVDEGRFTFEEKRIFQSDKKTKPSKTDRAFMLSEFASNIKEVEALLNWDCSDWK